MARWLFKVEPDCYDFADLERDGETAWDGVANPLARKHLRAVRPGDEVLYYHTGKEKAIVGVARVVAADGDADGVRVAAGRRLPSPVTLAAIKADPALAGWELVTQSRLSVMPVPDAAWKRIEALANGAESKGKKRAAG